MNQNQLSKDSNLFEGLRFNDLADSIDNIFTIDQYQSKMGNDRDVMVLRFRAAGREPAIDLMEFIEKGYPFVLDADMSSGEENDGQYSVFVELERNTKAPGNIKDLLDGISQLSGVKNWRFRWHKEISGHDVVDETLSLHIPLTPEDYDLKVEEYKNLEISEFFNQGALDSIVIEDRKITFVKPFAKELTAELIAIGDYNVLKNALQGGIQLDESSRNQVLYLNKFLGNYDINKIEGHFLVRNGEKAVILSKKVW